MEASAVGEHKRIPQHGAERAGVATGTLGAAEK